MNDRAKPRFRHSAQFPWFVLSVAVILVVAAGAAGVWFMRIEPMLQRFLGSI